MNEDVPPPEGLFPGGPADAYFPVVYQDLRRLAGRRLSKEKENHSLRPTELVHEVFLRLYKDPGLTVNDREHFLALSGLVMRMPRMSFSTGSFPGSPKSRWRRCSASRNGGSGSSGRFRRRG